MPEIRRIDSGKIACIEEKGPYGNLSPLFHQLKDFLNQRHVPYKDEHFAVIYDAPGTHDLNRLHFAAGLELAGETLGNGEVIVVTRPAGWLACETHRGSFEQLDETHQRLWQWAQSQGYRPSGAPYEFFLSGPLPGESADPGPVVVEIQLPVEKVG
ncbi:MAG: GyrI-like domain-containing protein [Candidatus Firestonebacteria bacterium]|nr:GyrI-like domain-containing protein [Candidatus Firestonebacteria bacterium]